MHIGEKVKARAKELRMGSTELARKVGTSKQNIYGIFNRASIDTALLQKLSKALEFDFFVYYVTVSGKVVNDPMAVYGKRSNKREPVSISSIDDVEKLRWEIGELREKYELLKALYEVKTGKKAPGAV